MIQLDISVNGKERHASIEPRTTLADFVREECSLTGTNLGCEQGVCGACTLMIDGAPMRSCIIPAVSCSGVEVRTIEDFDQDPLMVELRDAFTAEHALQCGYCTPGMLATARDIVTRLPDADEARIRLELSGNLCRCTGYVGLVRAVQRVLAAHRES
jgi:carbon-monoxide dehydrogenase small subunit